MNVVPEWLTGVLFGGLGGLAGQVATNPIDIVKIKLQLHKGEVFAGGLSRSRGWEVLCEHVKTQGFRGLFRGLPVAASHQFVYSGARLQTYEALKEMLSDDSTDAAEAGFSRRIVLASVSGVVATVLSNPLERCKVVIQAVPKEKCPSFPTLVKAFGRYSVDNTVSALKGEQRSRPQGLMGGVGASVQRSAIVHAVQLSVYDSLKDGADNILGVSQLASLVLASIFSGFASAGVGAPLDVVKTRLMAQQGREYSGVVDCVLRTVKEEGVSALFKGYLATWLKIGPFTVAQFWVWETLRRYSDDEDYIEGDDAGPAGETAA
eukprot:TRINITY_DN43711_c0_g1_i1.p1 TRINITY_DN43711_c0_g1~~TRINITY_DN43711_c0_g1_i1.p1  ORF type:complete len:320 (+),score=110.62 TRINITY_DN43711_c0_g1_i1:196-1155(+)